MHRPSPWMASLSIACILALTATASAQEAKSASPIATVTTGWTYLWADQGANYRANLNGWFARPAITIGHGYSGFADFTNYYGRNAKGSVNSHGFTFGVAKEVFAKPKIKPSIFAEAGDVRASSAGTITNQLAVAAGASFSIRSQNGSTWPSPRRSTSSSTPKATGATTTTPRSASASPSATAEAPQ